MRALVTTPGRRVALMCALAFVVYGGWAFGVNLRHGLGVARAAGLAQGVSSTISTLVISSAIELCLRGFAGRAGGWVLAWLLPPTLLRWKPSLLRVVCGACILCRKLGIDAV